MSAETPYNELNRLVERLRSTNPDMASEFEHHILAIEEEQRKTEAELSDKKNESERLKLFSDISDRCAIVLIRDSDSSSELLSWTIEKANPATSDIFETEAGKCIGHKLSDFLTASYSIALPDIIDENYSDIVELDAANIDKHLILYIHGQHSNNRIICSIADNTEIDTLRKQLNTHLQRFELITESLITLNSNCAYGETFTKLLERVGFHIAPKRAIIILNDDRNIYGEPKYQWCTNGSNPIPQDFIIKYAECPSWQKMLTERKMILGFQTDRLPEDIANLLTKVDISNAYIFPLTITNNEICGSFMVEMPDNKTMDNFDINYIKIISILISGHISRELITNDLIKEKERAEEADRLKSSFLVNMSHDIRIPVHSILGFSDLLADEDITQTDREEFIGMINKSGQDLVTLIDNIIDISEIETGQMKLRREEQKLKPMLESVIAMYKNDTKLTESEDLTLQLDISPKFNDTVIYTDCFRFKQICTNLIDNALKFTESGFVKLGISNINDNMIEFYVQDTGIGISINEQENIFKRFSKVDRSFAKEYKGTGIGLSICKSLIEMLGGEIHVASVLGKGSTFFFSHPLPTAKADRNTTSHVAKSPYNWEKRTIIIVDDIEQDKKYINYILSNTGIDIVWLCNGKEAIKYLEDGKQADIMIVEMNLNNMESVMTLHDNFPIPIIAQSSSHKTDEDRTFALKAGCIDFISKPLNMTTFLNTINNIFVNK